MPGMIGHVAGQAFTVFSLALTALLTTFSGLAAVLVAVAAVSACLPRISQYGRRLLVAALNLRIPCSLGSLVAAAGLDKLGLVSIKSSIPVAWPIAPACVGLALSWLLYSDLRDYRRGLGPLTEALSAPGYGVTPLSGTGDRVLAGILAAVIVLCIVATTLAVLHVI